MADDLESVITDIVADVEAGDSGGDGGSNEGSTAQGEAEGAAAGAAAAGTEQQGGAAAAVEGQQAAADGQQADDSFDKIPERVKDAIGRERENRIPYSSVKRIVTNAEKRLAELVLGKAPAGDKPFADQLKAHMGTYADYQDVKAYGDQAKAIEKIMVSDPDRFLTILKQMDPKYVELIDGKKAADGGAGSAGANAAAEPTPKDLPAPDLDVTLPDGSKAKTFSPDGLVGLVKAIAAQTREQVLGEVDTRFKPIKDSFESGKRVYDARQRITEMVNTARASWKGFKEYESDILAAVNTGKFGRLEDAYMHVVHAKHDEAIQKANADRNKVRGEVIEELKKAPKGTSAASGVKPSKAAEDETLEDVIAANLPK